MSQVTYRANLSAKAFPMLPSNWGRTVIVPQYDNTFSRQLASQEDQDKDVGIPQIFYCHNVIATQQGFQSVGFAPQLAAPAGGHVFGPFIDISGVTNELLLMSVVDGTSIWVYEYGAWVFKTNAIPVTGDISVATTQGVTYIYIAGVGCYTYDLIARTFTAVTLTGVDPSRILGVTDSSGYLIAWSKQVAGLNFSGDVVLDSPVIINIFPNTTGMMVNDPVTGGGFADGTTIVSIDSSSQITVSANSTINGVGASLSRPLVPATVLWSSTISPTDFVPSLVTGAGGGGVEQAKGSITICYPHTLGFFVLTSGNIIMALYTNNARYPFQFREIVGSGGLTNKAAVTHDANTGNLYVYSSSGLQLITTSQANTVFPEVTDFLGGYRIEDYDEVNNVFVTTILSNPMSVALNVIADRYLTISYGNNTLDHILLYDLVMKRWGKLRTTHINCIENYPQSLIPDNSPRHSMWFCKADGSAVSASLEPEDSGADGLIVLGKYQFVRPRLLQLNEINIENIPQGSATVIGLFSSLDGKNYAYSTPYKNADLGGYQQYYSRVEGINHCLIVQGNFNITSIVLNFNITAKR